MSHHQPTVVETELESGLDEVREMLVHTSPEGLLKAYASLTHRMHGATPSAEHTRRMERDLVEGELLRRLKGVRDHTGA